MEVNVLNCNNIKTANVSIIEGRLNIKYAINGTGKSTLSKAIVAASTGDSNALSSLTPYQYIGDLDPEHANVRCSISLKSPSSFTSEALSKVIP